MMAKRTELTTLTLDERREGALKTLEQAILYINREFHIDVTPIIQENVFVRNGLQVREEWAIIALSPQKE